MAKVVRAAGRAIDGLMTKGKRMPLVVVVGFDNVYSELVLTCAFSRCAPIGRLWYTHA